MKIVIVTCDKCGARQELPEDEYRRPSHIASDMQETLESCSFYGIDLCEDCRKYLHETFMQPMKELMAAREEWLPKRSE